MKQFILSTVAILTFAIVLNAPAPGQDAKIGDEAAPLSVSEWVKGGPVDLSENAEDTIYVVEFWATWCPPCRASIPHLTDLSEQYKDKKVVITGVTWEDPAVVKPFVEEMGDKMNYNVAVDKDRETMKGYMEAYGAMGIPHAFIVENGKVSWEGHPMAGLDKEIEKRTATADDGSSKEGSSH